LGCIQKARANLDAAASCRPENFFHQRVLRRSPKLKQLCEQIFDAFPSSPARYVKERVGEDPCFLVRRQFGVVVWGFLEYDSKRLAHFGLVGPGFRSRRIVTEPAGPALSSVFSILRVVVLSRTPVGTEERENLSFAKPRTRGFIDGLERA